MHVKHQVLVHDQDEFFFGADQCVSFSFVEQRRHQHENDEKSREDESGQEHANVESQVVERGDVHRGDEGQHQHQEDHKGVHDVFGLVRVHSFHRLVNDVNGVLDSPDDFRSVGHTQSSPELGRRLTVITFLRHFYHSCQCLMVRIRVIRLWHATRQGQIAVDRFSLWNNRLFCGFPRYSKLAKEADFKLNSVIFK